MINEETENRTQNATEHEELTEMQQNIEMDSPGSTLETEAPSRDQEIQELKDKYLRLLAEFENFKKRSAKERIDFAKFASQELMTSMLTVIDDFDREVKAGQTTEGSKLIHNKLVQILKQKGLQEMNSTGEPFDSSLHEAITELPVGDEMKNKVIDTVEKGYYLNEKIIRYAKVVVGK